METRLQVLCHIALRQTTVRLLRRLVALAGSPDADLMLSEHTTQGNGTKVIVYSAVVTKQGTPWAVAAEQISASPRARTPHYRPFLCMATRQASLHVFLLFLSKNMTLRQ